jgi:hypothetical protein
VDFVYICRAGDNEELRYSIRSVVNSFPEARIWVVGGKPDWYTGHYIEVCQTGSKYANAINNLNAACSSEDISNTFVLMNDDFFILKNVISIKNFYSGSLQDKIDKYINISGHTAYIRKLISTNNKLSSSGVSNPLDYELHLPMIMEKNKLHFILDKYPTYLWRSVYGNLYKVGGDIVEDVKIYSNNKYNERSKSITDDSTFISTEDQSFDMIKDKIVKLFPNPSIYESPWQESNLRHQA